MPFVTNYTGASRVLSHIGTGTCSGPCKKTWIRRIKYALQSKTNRLGLTDAQRKKLTEKAKKYSGRNAVNNHAKTLKKYRTRNSPPYPANVNCNKNMKGNDGRMYRSRYNRIGVCSWRLKNP